MCLILLNVTNGKYNVKHYYKTSKYVAKLVAFLKLFELILIFLSTYATILTLMLYIMLENFKGDSERLEE